MMLSFIPGDDVEVSSDEEGYAGAYFSAAVVRLHPFLRRYTVEYSSLLSDNGSTLRETVDARHVRPAPPASSSRRPELHDSVDAFYNDAWWTGVVYGGIAKGRVLICFPYTRELIELALSEIRPHLEWINGQWLSPKDLEIPSTIYEKGTKIEVANVKENSVISWIPVIITKTIWKNNFLVEYLNLELNSNLKTEIVDIKYIRPLPPATCSINFSVSDEVEAYWGHSWWPGKIIKISQGYFGKYTFKSVHLGKEMEFVQGDLRPRFNWVEGRWIRAPQKIPVIKFTNGMKVEVSSDDEGFKGAWYTGTVLKVVHKNFLVQYETLKTEDESDFLTEIVDSYHIRPVPPVRASTGTGMYQLLEEVDAFYNDGWWVGLISRVRANGKYLVYFKHWREEMEFQHEELRPHFDWICGRWIRAYPGLEL